MFRPAAWNEVLLKFCTMVLHSRPAFVVLAFQSRGRIERGIVIEHSRIPEFLATMYENASIKWGVA
jgi:hypothetical protein